MSEAKKLEKSKHNNLTLAAYRRGYDMNTSTHHLTGCIDCSTVGDMTTVSFRLPEQVPDGLRWFGRVFVWLLALMFLLIGAALTLTLFGAIAGVPMMLSAVWLFGVAKKMKPVAKSA